MLSVGGQEEAVEAPEAPAPFNGLTYAQSLPGVTGPLGFFDPLPSAPQTTSPRGRSSSTARSS